MTAGPVCDTHGRAYIVGVAALRFTIPIGLGFLLGVFIVPVVGSWTLDLGRDAAAFLRDHGMPAVAGWVRAWSGYPPTWCVGMLIGYLIGRLCPQQALRQTLLFLLGYVLLEGLWINITFDFIWWRMVLRDRNWGFGALILAPSLITVGFTLGAMYLAERRCSKPQSAGFPAIVQ